MKKGAFVTFVIAVMLVAGAATAGDWQKLGKETVVFGSSEKTASIEAKGDPVNQIAFKITGEWVRLNEVTLSFSDGSTQTIEDIDNVRPGFTTDAFAIDGGPKTVTSIDFSFQANSSAQQGRATVTVLGQ